MWKKVSWEWYRTLWFTSQNLRWLSWCLWLISLLLSSVLCSNEKQVQKWHTWAHGQIAGTIEERRSISSLLHAEDWQLAQCTNSTAALPKQHIVQWSVCRKRGGLPQTEQTTVLLAPSSSPPVCQQRPSMLLKWTLMWENEGRKYSSWRLQSVGNVPGIHIPLNRSQLEVCVWSSLSINSGCALEVDTPVGKARSQIWQLAVGSCQSVGKLPTQLQVCDWTDHSLVGSSTSPPVRQIAVGGLKEKLRLLTSWRDSSLVCSHLFSSRVFVSKI